MPGSGPEGTGIGAAVASFSLPKAIRKPTATAVTKGLSG